MRPLNHRIQNWRGRRIWLVGASSGIGAALAQEALGAGAELALSARRKERLQAIADTSRHAMAVPFDVQDQEAWMTSYLQICQRFGGVDLIIFCAADYHPERSWEVTPAGAALMLDINLASVYSGLATVLPEMLLRGSGGIAIVASVAGYVGLPNASVYGPSKAALINLAELLYADLHPKGLDVYLINPGFVQTPLTERNDFPMPALQTPEAAAKAICSGMAAGRFEIHFPRRFTFVFKVLRLLPYRLRLAFTTHLSKA